MEKFYEVTGECKLKEEYLAFLENGTKVNSVYRTFAKEHGIEATKYYPTTDNLYIIPTKNDVNKFGSQLIKKCENEGLRRFRVNSKINKSWIKVLEESNLKVLSKPYVPIYFNVYGRIRTRIFAVEGRVYCSISTKHDFTNPRGFNEIKASEFFKTVEDYNDSIKEN